MIDHDMMNLYDPTWPARPLEPAPHPARPAWWTWLARRRQRRAYARSLQILFW